VQREPFELTITDEFETAAEVPIECALITQAAVQPQENGLILNAGRESLHVEIVEASARFLHCEQPTYMKRGMTEPASINRLVFLPAIHGLNASLTLRLK
jgi:hypothetical protein